MVPLSNNIELLGIKKVGSHSSRRCSSGRCWSDSSNCVYFNNSKVPMSIQRALKWYPFVNDVAGNGSSFTWLNAPWSLADQDIVDKYNFDKFGLYNSWYDSSD